LATRLLSTNTGTAKQILKVLKNSSIHQRFSAMDGALEFNLFKKSVAAKERSGRMVHAHSLSQISEGEKVQN
jgi:hypothetical protein